MYIHVEQFKIIFREHIYLVPQFYLIFFASRNHMIEKHIVDGTMCRMIPGPILQMSHTSNIDMRHKLRNRFVFVVDVMQQVRRYTMGAIECSCRNETPILRTGSTFP